MSIKDWIKNTDLNKREKTTNLFSFCSSREIKHVQSKETMECISFFLSGVVFCGFDKMCVPQMWTTSGSLKSVITDICRSEVEFIPHGPSVIIVFFIIGWTLG